MALKFSKLTRPAIRALQAGEKLAEHGIIADRLRNGDLRFTVNIMVDGERIHRVVGKESEGVTREQAERTIESLRTKAREGRLDLPRGRKTHRSFADAGEEYLERIEHHPKHGRNMKVKRHHIRRRLAPYFKTQRPDRLTDFAISHYIRHRREEGAATATINRELSTLSHFLNRCLEWRWIRERPKITKGEESRKKIVVLTPEHQRRLMAAAVADQDDYCWLFVAFGLNTGMRHSEILRVRWTDIDFEQRRIYIGKAKAGQREQPITSALTDMLKREREQRKDQDGYIFAVTRRDGKRGYRMTMTRQFQRAVIRAGLDPAKVTPHVMRHTAITQLVKAGVDLPTIQTISGHKTLAMVLRYTHLSGTHIDSAMENIEAGFPDSITPKLHTGSDADKRGAA